MADTWLTDRRKASILDYISEGANLDDLLAAGYSEAEISEAVPKQAPQNFEADPRDSVQPYKPTFRENLSVNTSKGLKSLGLPEGVARDLGESFAGTSGEPFGLADLTPLGALFGGQEGLRQIERGRNSEDYSDVALGALDAGLSLAEALPGGVLAKKGLTKLADRLVKDFDPATVRMFFGPTSPRADLGALEDAERMLDGGNWSEEEIWQRTGWWKGPNGWRFEVSDDALELPIDPTDKKLSSVEGPLTSLVHHPDFYESLPAGSQSAKTVAEIRAYLEQGPRGGGFDARGKSLTATGETTDELKGVVLHELQHLVQQMEDVPGKGTNPGFIAQQIDKTFSGLPRVAKEYLAERNVLDNDIRFYTKEREKLLSAGKSDPYSNYIASDLTEALTELKRQRNSLKQNFGRLYTTEFRDSLEEFHNVVGGYSAGLKRKISESYNPTNNKDKLIDVAFNLYEKDAGEIEARLTQARRNLTAAERALRLPSEDLDVPLAESMDQYDRSRLFNNILSSWDNVSQRRGYAEGGEVRDPVSGNEVPVGAKPEEVRDDIPIMASEGEYVIPANVVRYIGLDRIEKLVKQAKKGLEELEAEGRIGGQKPETPEEGLPFSPEELLVVDEPDQPPGMAEGGLVGGDMRIDPTTGLPLWLLDRRPELATDSRFKLPGLSQPPSTAHIKEENRDRDPAPAPTGLARPISEWGLDDFTKYTNTRNSVDNAVAKTLVGMTVPFGKMAMKAQDKLTENGVKSGLQAMIKSGVDSQGNTLTPEQIATAKSNLQRLQDEPLDTTRGVSRVARKILEQEGLIPQRDATKNPTKKPEGFISKALSKLVDKVSGTEDGSSTSSVKTADKSSGNTTQNKSPTSVENDKQNDDRDPTPTPTPKVVEEEEEPNTRTVYAKGGLIARRK